MRQEIGKRPSNNDKKIIEAAVDKYLEEFLRWNEVEIYKDCDFYEQHVQDVENDLLKCVNYYSDPFDIASDLDRMSNWNPNKELLDIIESTQWEIGNQHKAAVKKWVEDNGLKLEFDIGDMVKFKKPQAGICSGEITKLYPETLKYLVFNKAARHVKTGLGTNGIIKIQEDLEN